MSENQKLVQIVKDAQPAFESYDVGELKNIFVALSAELMNCDDLDFRVFDAIWHCAQQLQSALALESDPDKDNLDSIYEQLNEGIRQLTGESKEIDEVTTIEEPAIDISEEEEAKPQPVESTADYLYTIPEDDVPLVEDFIIESAEHLEAAEGAMLEQENNLQDNNTLNLIFRSFHTIKGMAGFLNLDQIGSLAHEAEGLLDLARSGSLQLADNNADAIFQAIDMLKSMIDSLRTAVEGDRILRARSGLKELVRFIAQCAANDSEISKTEITPEDEEIEAETPIIASQKTGSSQIEEKIKVSTTRLDSLVNMVGELVIAHLMVTESLKASYANDQALQRNASHQSKIIRELQELSMSMRMVPISGIFQKMARMTRDLSHKAGKKIDFSIQGEQTELDRNIVDMLADPLIHMIRNSVDHGIETAAERRAIGKLSSGKVELRASHLAGNIVIEIEDNGRGINRERLLEKAIINGIEDAEKNMTDRDILNLIFHPGLSTAEKITSVSGRGVGMDVVRRNIEELQGRIDIESTPGEGTTFTITLPLTLAIIDGQIVRVGNEKYIIPINAIRKSFCPESEQITTVQNRKEMIMDRDELLPLVRTHELFNIEPDSRVVEDGLLVIVEKDNQACCLLVDDLLDQQQVVIKNLGNYLKHTPGISGGAIMGDGKVSLILDIAGILKLYKD